MYKNFRNASQDCKHKQLGNGLLQRSKLFVMNRFIRRMRERELANKTRMVRPLRLLDTPTLE